MKETYFWFYVAIITLATLFNYWLVSENRGWNSSSSGGGHYSNTGSWHK